MKKEEKLLLIPLGGLGEVGKNMLVVEYGNDIVLIDAGLMFPEDELLGIDVVIPDITYLQENKDKLRAIIITHGHEDHIGALPYILKDFDVPVYGMKLAIAIIKSKFNEIPMTREPIFQLIKPKDVLKFGEMEFEIIQSTHSIPDSVAIFIKTPVGNVFHTGDFKLDQTPVDGKLLDINRIAQISEEGVMVMLSDSTNVEKAGFTQSEKVVGEAFNEQFRVAKGRIIIATFASNVHRIKQAIDAAIKFEKKVCIVGRSMENVTAIAQEIGYLTIPEGTLITLNEINNYPTEEMVIITTGSQGEPMAALSRMAKGDHRQIKIDSGDTVIISATPIPGNEKSVYKTIDLLFRLGAKVVYEKSSGTHVSGHASRDELKLILNLVKPEYFIPVHGEYRMLLKHGELAEELGVKKENIFVAENGNVIEFTKEKGCISGKVPAGRVLVDGLGVGDIGNIVLRDRRQLSQDGILIVVATLNRQATKLLAGPDIVSRGFVYVRESEDLMLEAKRFVQQNLEVSLENGVKDWATLKNNIRDSLGRFLYEKTKRRPMILPIIVEV
ncbi:MAG: ribonuclease J [Eubacteriales bacterium]|nr:ribonuclease J [Eubacteriales bacterium]